MKPLVRVNIPVTLCEGDFFNFRDSIITQPGDYFFQSIDGSCDTTYNINLIVTELNASITANDLIINCADNGYVTISGKGYIAGSGMSFRWLEMPDEEKTDVQIGQPGTYHFVLFAGQCTDTAKITITADNDIPIIDYSIQQIDCCHQFGKINITISNVTINNYSWLYEGNPITENSNQLTSDKPGNYTVIVTSTAGCEAIFNLILPIDTIKPEAAFTYSDITCTNPESTIKLNTNDELVMIQWVGLPDTGKTITVDKGGTYHVFYTAPNCCTSHDSITIKSFKDKPDITISGGNLDCLFKSANLDFTSNDVLISYQWTLPDNSLLKDKKITVSEPGIYYLDVINEHGCIHRDSIQVSEDQDPPDIFIPNFPEFIPCGTDSIRIGFSSADPIINVEWSGPGLFSSNEVNPYVKYPGTYYVTVTGRNHCIAFDSLIVLHDNTVPVVQINTDTINCVDKIVNLSLNYSGNYSFNWEDKFNNIYTGDQVNSLVSGIYSLTVTDNVNNCESYFLTEVPVDTLIKHKELFTSALLDCNNDFVKLYLGDYDKIESVKWYSSSFASFADTAKVDKPGMYYVDVFPENKCNYTDSIMVMTGEYITLYSDTLILTCKDSIQKLILPGVNPAYSFSWEGPSGYTSVSASPEISVPGDYSVTVSNGNCTESTTITVLEDKEIPVIAIEFDSIIDCNPGYATINGIILSGEISIFSWDGPGLFSTTSLVNFVDDAGDYVFKVEGKNGCTDSLVAKIKKSQNYPVLSVKGDTMTCLTALLPLEIQCTVNSQYSTLEWIYPDGSRSNKLKNIVDLPGKYYCIVKNELECETIDSVYVVIDTLKPLVYIPLPDTLTCYNESVSIDISTSPQNCTIGWTGPYGFSSDSAMISAYYGGDYVYKAKSDNGCISSDTVNVKVNRLRPYIFITGNNINGYNSKAKLEIKTTANLYTLVWEWPDGTESYEDSLRTLIDGVYKITVTDLENGCQSVDSIIITVDTIGPDIVTENYYLPCDSSLIKMHVYSNKAGTIFYWYGPDNFYSEGAIAYTNKSGVYYVFGEGTNGVISKDSVIVYSIHILPEFEALGNKITCSEDSVVIKAAGVHDDKSFIWKGPGNFESKERDPVISIPGVYKLVVTGNNNCIDSVSILVEVDTIKPLFSIYTNDSLVCENNKAKLKIQDQGSSNNPLSYIWNSSDGILDYGIYSSEVVVIGAGVYSVKVTDIINGCSSVDSIRLESKAYKLDSIGISLKHPTCYGFSDGYISIDTVYGGIGPYQFSTDNYYFSNIKNFNSKKAGSYRIYAKDKNGCRVDTSILLPDGADIQVKLITEKEEIFIGNSVGIDALINAPNGIREIIWEPKDRIKLNPDSLNIEFNPLESSYVSLEVIDSNGCRGDDDVWIRVLSKPDIYVPDIFTPDGDGVNDYYFIKIRSGVKSIREFKIFDRWGELLYSKSNVRLNVPVDGWDGKYNGKVVNNGVYICYIYLELENGKEEKFYSDLTLLK